MNFDLFSLDFCLMLFDGDIKIAVSVLSLCFVYNPGNRIPAGIYKKKILLSV